MMRALGLAGLLFAVAALALTAGQVHLDAAALWQGITGGDGPGALTIRILRGPRVAVGLGAGAALGLSGAIFQSLLRNPLASPDVMGFTAGSGLAILASITAGLSLPMPLVAAAGGLATAVLVAILARPPGGARGVEGTPALTLVLVGIGVGFTTASVGSFLMTRLSGPQAAEAHRWLAGSLSARDWGHGLQIALIGGLFALVLVPQVRALKLLELGPELAAGLGLRVRRARVLLAATGVGLAAAAVAVVGPVAFVALMAPPVGARLSGARGAGGRLAAAAAAGAIIVVLADLVARASLPGLQLPIGVMTGILGAPYLLWRLSREMERGEL
ncbi:iron chelate uptake ABC transporter family permease subunit [Breoghania sp. L-A4]|uniref:iron chelate uptake ABC transporter family permease subunit n=1 Tax=Breoghania sp. L-A4 TaxID=2304600 RepID=UPI000E358BEB|nr:iron chelate uptake ABC transporter family permease subunit [Breoghania sp. L-A4]AXS40757.1 iron ABC transporter permease [Breoghania sp. L-A4]